MVEIVNLLLASGTVVLQIILVVSIAVMLIGGQIREVLLKFIKNYGSLTAFLLAAVGVLASLFYSEIAGFQPCFLCWWQRIFLYPIAIILGLGLWKKDPMARFYALILAILGGLVALYHVFITYGGTSLIPCPATGADCLKLYVFEFGYITIPLMALTTFVSIAFLLVVDKKV